MKLYQELRLERKHARIIGVTLSVVLLLIAAFTFIVLKSLPSTAKLRATYFSSRLHKPVAAESLGGTVSSTTQAAAPAPTPAPVAAVAPTPPPAQRTLADYATERFIDQSDRSLSVCNSLASLTTPAPVGRAGLDQQINAQISSGLADPFVDAVLAPLGAILQLPNVAAVVTQLRDAQDSGDTSLLRQAEFYSTVALAASDIYSNKSTIDRVSEHAYHLSVLARIAATIPGSGSDPALQDLCTAAEARALTPSTASLQDEAFERASLVQVIAAMGLTPQQAGFDPNLSAQVSVQVTPTQLVLTSPWMSQLYGSGLQVSVAR